MLRQRVITAVALLLLMVAALRAEQAWPFALLSLVLIAAAAWEWGRLNQATASWAVGMGLAFALGGAWAWISGWTEHLPPATWWLASALWVLGGSAALRSGPAQWPRLPPALRWALGLLGLWAAWLALIQARAIGINFMLSLLCLVWAADIAAYFGGRALGRRKLAPSISPGKSWEGVWSGVVGVLLLAAAWVWVDTRFAVDSDSLYTQLGLTLGWAAALLCLLALSALSVLGDLFESLVKRAAGAKDSSRLLPGHGGVLDRVDALLPVLPVALALTTLGAP